MQRHQFLCNFGVGGLTYAQNLATIFGSDLLAYWPQWELSGTTAFDQSGNGRNGTYEAITLAQVGIGDGRTSALYGAGSNLDVYSASLNAAFNGQEFSFFTWAKILNAGVWADGNQRYIVRLRVNASNQIIIRKETAGNIGIIYSAGGTTKTTTGVVSSTDWMRIAGTVSLSNNRLKLYINAAQGGTTQTTLGSWVGALSSTACTVGAQDLSGSTPWSGWLAHTAIIGREVTENELLEIDSPFDLAPVTGLLAYGDSKTYGTGDDNPPADGANGYVPILLSLLGSAWHEIPPRIARPGYTVAMMQAEIDADMATATGVPDRILIDLGANDIEPLADPVVAETWQANLGYILDAMHTRWPSAKIYVARIWRRFNNGQMADLNSTWIPTVLSTRSDFAYLGIDERVFLENGDNGVTYTTDGIHPNHAGYVLTAQQWQAVMS